MFRRINEESTIVYFNTFKIDKAREAMGAKALTQRQVIDEIERKIDRMEERSGPKK